MNSVLSFHTSACPQDNTKLCENVVVRSQHRATNRQCCSNVDVTILLQRCLNVGYYVLLTKCFECGNVVEKLVTSNSQRLQNVEITASHLQRCVNVALSLDSKFTLQ